MMNVAQPLRSVALAMSVLVLCGGCAGYQIGGRTLFPPDIHTVYVPIFESESLRPFLGERLTEAVVKQIELTTPYKVVGTPAADSVMTGRIVTERKPVLLGNRYGDVREAEIDLAVRVSWVNRKGDLIRQTPVLPIPPELVELTASAAVAPEFGRSIATGQQQAIDRLARQIVALMETPW